MSSDKNIFHTFYSFFFYWLCDVEILLLYVRLLGKYLLNFYH